MFRNFDPEHPMFHSYQICIRYKMLSKKAQYALQAIRYLVARENQDPVSISEIADAKNIPLKFLENILLGLKKNNILESKKGKGGGYFLDKGIAKKTSVATVIRVIDGPLSLLPCVSLYFYEKCEHCEESCCSINRIFSEARDATLKVLEKRMLKDLA